MKSPTEKPVSTGSLLKMVVTIFKYGRIGLERVLGAAVDVVVVVVGEVREVEAAEPSMMVDGFTKSRTSSGPQVRTIAGAAVAAVVDDLEGLRVDDGLDLHRRLDLEEVVEAGMADELGVDDVPAEGADAVHVALRRVLDDEAGYALASSVVADATVGERAGDEVGGIGDAPRHGARRRRGGDGRGRGR